MKKTITSENKPIKLWLEDIDEAALQQARNLANLSVTYKWVAIMPDCHKGFGMPIGGVLATEGVIIPNAVGVDIGCGMCAVKTSLTSINKKDLSTIVKHLYHRIPKGRKHHKHRQNGEGFDNAPDIDIIQQELDKARYQLGTLGGGNHFVEIQKGSDGHIWLMLHSGSRNFGLKIANAFHQKAVKYCDDKNVELPDKSLAWLPMESSAGQAYHEAMNFALTFAKANRFAMMEKVKQVMKETIDDIQFGEIINIHHNYAAVEKHYGKEVVVHRKGATSAKAGQDGIIPGSQGAASYIVKGKGNPESFMSCSHGAGRKLGRKQAVRTLNLAKETKLLDDAGIIHSIRTKKNLDEAAGAYKDIDVVMKNQEDLVDIVTQLLPLAVIKG
ncbi:MAG: RtcB family protein [Bacteroidota bacterium]